MLPWDYCARSEETGQCVLMRPQYHLLAQVPRPKPFACIINEPVEPHPQPLAGPWRL